MKPGKEPLDRLEVMIRLGFKGRTCYQKANSCKKQTNIMVVRHLHIGRKFKS